MKKVLPLLLLLFGIAPYLNAQWTSAGNGTTYTMNDLVAASGGAVTNSGTTFTVNSDITIAAGDILKIDDQVSRIDAPGMLITIQGTMVCENTTRVGIYGTLTQHFSMRFEGATGCELKKLYFSDGAGIKLIESEVDFIDCKFLYFTRDYSGAVVDFFNCDPSFVDCVFMINNGAAISSPANGQGSPSIVNCTFDENVKDGVNSPQINLGPGSSDTIRIIGNNVDGTYCQGTVGGISIADLTGTGSTKALIQNNIVKNHRYGYNQQGMTIASVIEGNQFIDNNTEANPMNGGSGISIYGLSENCSAIIRNNVITGNLWGITSIYVNHVDLGTAEDWGHNVIHDNGNGGVVYDLYNNSTCDITAVGNDWGSTDEAVIEDHIFHQPDDASLGLVTYIPYVDETQVEELCLEELDLSECILYTLQGQRVSYGSLTPGVYIAVATRGSSKIAKKIIIK